MLNIVASNPLPFIIAVLIGLAVAWWVWGRKPQAVADATEEIGEAEANAAAAEQADNSETANEAEAEVAAADETPDPVPPVGAIPAGSAAGAAAVAAALPADNDEDESPPKPKIAQAVGDPDDLERIRGVGPKLNRLLISLGVLRFDQIAAWDDSDVAEVDGHLGAFKGRIDRDNWVEQAKLLAEDKDDVWEQRFGGRNQ